MPDADEVSRAAGMSGEKFRNLLRRWQNHIKKAGGRGKILSPHEYNWPRRLAITVKIKDDAAIIVRTIALSMPYTEGESIFNACIIRDKRRTDCLMDRKGYFKVLKTISSVSFSLLQPSRSPLSRDILFIIEIGETYGSQGSRFQWKNPAPETLHCLEYIWTLFGRVIRERNFDIRLDDLIRY